MESFGWAIQIQCAKKQQDTTPSLSSKLWISLYKNTQDDKCRDSNATHIILLQSWVNIWFISQEITYRSVEIVTLRWIFLHYYGQNVSSSMNMLTKYINVLKLIGRHLSYDEVTA